MSSGSFGCCYFPTRVLCVDDNLSFLKSLKMRLGRQFPCATESHPKKVIEFVKNTQEPYRMLKTWLLNLKDLNLELGSVLEENDYARTYIDIDLFAIHKEIYRADRFDEISVMVVDYDMPAMDGISLCKELRSYPIKKLMLTGEADTDLAVNAFNEGIIDHFMVKGPADLDIQLCKAIEELQSKYFRDVTAPIMKALTLSERSCLDDPVFIDFFKEFLSVRKIKEYYLVGESGCFLCLSESGQPTWLIVKHEKELDDYIDIANEYGAPSSITKALKDKKKLLYLFSRNDEYETTVDQWRPYLHPATCLPGKKGTYYYSIIEGNPLYDDQLGKWYSYQEYLDKRKAKKAA